MQPLFVLIMKKNLFWTAVFAAVIAVCTAVYAALYGAVGKTADIYVDGKLYRSVSLSTDCSFRVNTDRGYNDICIKNGTISVTAADCPDKVCVKSGICTGSAPIVCLPHRLTIQINTKDNTDSVSK